MILLRSIILVVLLLINIEAKFHPFGKKRVSAKRRMQSEISAQCRIPLSGDFLPLRYNLNVYPHFLWGFPGMLNTFDADVEVLAEAKTKTSRLVMNAENLQMKNVSGSLDDRPIVLSYKLL